MRRRASVGHSTWAAAVVLGGLAGCGTGHIGEYTPKVRDYKQPVEQTAPDATDASGSLFVDNGALLDAVTDVRALEVNDIVVVQIVEIAQAERSASTDVDKNGGLSFGFGMGPATAATTDGVTADLALKSGNVGRTARQDDVRFTVAATVKKKFANGNLFVEGHRVIMVNDEEHHYYISGVARPADIDAGNRIWSDRLADAEVELTGRGIVSEAQEPGWITKFFKWINPF